MREINLDQLRTLIAIFDLGSFAAAARALHLSQPTVSLHVRELESRLDAHLVLRGARQAQPTPAGAVLAEHARRLLREADEAVQAVRRCVEGVSGRVRLGTSTGVLVYLLPQVLARMAQQHPDIHVEVRIVGSFDGMAMIAQGTLDVALIAPPERAADVVVTRWRRDPLMAILPADWAAPRHVTPQWLARRPLIANDPTTLLYRQTVEWFAAAGIVPRPRIELNYNEAMKSLVASGYGAAIMPVEGPAQAQNIRGIQVVPLKPAIARETCIVHRPLPFLDGAARQVLAVLKGMRQSAWP